MSGRPAPPVFRAAVEAAEFGVVIADASAPPWPTVYVNPAFERNTGYPAAEVIGRDLSFLQGTDRKQPRLFRLRRALKAAEPVVVTLRNYRKDGALFWNRLSVAPIFDEDGRTTHFVGVQYDVTRRVRAELQLLRVLERVGDALFTLDPDWRFVWVNRLAGVLLDRKPDELAGRRIWDVFPGALDSDFGYNCQRAMRRMQPLEFVGYFKPLDKWFDVRIFPGLDGLAVYFRDVTEQHVRERRLEYLAAHDMLTGLPNRERCLARLGECVEAARAGRCALALLYFDLDGFKDINDSIGHAAGDEVLRQVASRLLAASRSSKGWLARLSGDEFVLLVDSRDAEALVGLADRMIASVREPIQVGERQWQIGASAGLAIYPDAGTDAESMLVNADLAMLTAKQGGRGRAKLFDSSIMLTQKRRMHLLHEMRQPRFEEQLAAHYQPKLFAGSSRLCGFEALARWTHPQLGPVAPNEFVPLAEESGDITRLGAWIIDTVCGQLRQWLDEGLPVVPVSVNVSVGQIERGGFLATIDAALQRHRVPPALLQVEITETLLMRSFEVASCVLGGLAERGIEVHLDDFGTGYSSLSTLWQLPVACVKLDRSFTRGLAKGGGSETVVRSAIGLAHALSKTVVAEGVETCEQELMLREMGCDQLQGFMFSRPVEVPAATAFIRGEHGPHDTPAQSQS